LTHIDIPCWRYRGQTRQITWHTLIRLSQKQVSRNTPASHGLTQRRKTGLVSVFPRIGTLPCFWTNWGSAMGSCTAKAEMRCLRRLVYNNIERLGPVPHLLIGPAQSEKRTSTKYSEFAFLFLSFFSLFVLSLFPPTRPLSST